MAVPEKFKKLANAVRDEIYGKDVREAIAKSIEETGESSETAIKITEQLIDGSFDEAELTTEIERRLNELEEEYAPELNSVKSQLAQTETDLNDRGININKFKNLVSDDDWFDAVETAITEMNVGETLYFPPNNLYKISKKVLVDKRIKIDLGGSVLTSTEEFEGNYLLEVINSNVTMANGHVKGNGSLYGGINVNYCDNVLLNDLHFSALGAEPIMFSENKRSKAVNITITDCQKNSDFSRYGHINLNYSDQCSISNLKIWDSYGRGVAFRNAKHCKLTDYTADNLLIGGGAFYFTNAEHNTVSNVIGKNIRTNGFKLSRRSNNNKIENVSLQSNTSSAFRIQGGSDNLISNSVFVMDSSSEGDGGEVLLLGAHPETEDDCLNNIISNCKLINKDSGAFGVIFEEVIGLKNENNKLINCTIEALNTNVIRLFSPRNSVIEGCTIVSEGVDSTRAIEDEESEGTTIKNCKVVSEGEGASANAIRSEGTTNTRIIECVLIGYGDLTVNLTSGVDGAIFFSNTIITNKEGGSSFRGEDVTNSYIVNNLMNENYYGNFDDEESNKIVMI